MSWQIDFAHSYVGFTAHSFNLMTVKGVFADFSGTVVLDEDDPTQTTVEVEVRTASVETGNPKRDENIRSANYLQVEQFPLMTFRSERVEVITPEHARLIGRLTIRSVTREVALRVDQVTRQDGTHIYNAAATIDRRDWGMTNNQVPGMVSNLITLEIRLAVTSHVPTLEAALAADPVQTDNRG